MMMHVPIGEPKRKFKMVPQPETPAIPAPSTPVPTEVPTEVPA